MSSTKRVVIIGNGAAGSQLAAKLAKSKQCNVTVITPFNYSEISVNMTKSIAVGADEYMKSVFPLLKEDKVEYVIDKCVSLTSSSVVLDSERTIEFDVCIVATGQNIPVFFPDVNSTNFSERKKVVCDVSDRIKSASSVVVGGGGAIGTELAADIKLRNKDKR
jgi:NADH dehydrogenase FAD-containing subunit